jgi:hypothetical protein
VGPFFHPAMGRVSIAFEFGTGRGRPTMNETLRLGDATGLLRSDPFRCITGTLRFAYVVGGKLPSELCGIHRCSSGRGALRCRPAARRIR